jgi:hypothetical protein
MKVVKKTEIPPCDFCHAKAIADVPTRSGRWANVCVICFETECDMPYAAKMGSKLEFHTPAAPVKDSKIFLANELTSMEEVVCDGSMREVECPNCGESRRVEPDADYVFTCEGCDVKVRCRDIIEVYPI